MYSFNLATKMGIEIGSYYLINGRTKKTLLIQQKARMEKRKKKKKKCGGKTLVKVKNIQIHHRLQTKVNYLKMRCVQTSLWYNG